MSTDILKKQNNFIGGEKAYPVYHIRVSWVNDTQDTNLGEGWTLGLTEGKIWNGTSFYKMFKEDLDIKEVKWKILEWWKGYRSSDKLKDKNPELFSIDVTELGYETWVCDWFCHHTYDVGQSDEEVLLSFSRFVDRQIEKGREDYLMGANDRWRWRGENDHDPAPCRCDNCKKSGVIRILH